MLGEVVHNEHVINELKSKGLKLVKNFNKIPDIKKGILIIQSHGISAKIYYNLKKRNIPFIDSTCILVKHIHNAIKKLAKEGYYPVIIGDKNHTEVQGIAGQVKESIIINHEREINQKLFKGINKIGVVFQSTFIKKNGEKIEEKLKQTVKEVKIIDTICKPTKDRQSELRINARAYDYVFVIGSKTSANTKHLYRISKELNQHTFYIEKPEDVLNVKIKDTDTCFVTSGASTPLNIIDKTLQLLQKSHNKFKLFSKRYIPLIEGSIGDFFSRIPVRDKEFSFNVKTELSEELKKYCSRPGKRIRPLLLILSYIGFKGDEGLKEVIKLAAGVEIMHSFLLIHDDIIDRAPMRRGGKSLHLICKEKFCMNTFNEKIGDDVALVLGDILFAEVIALIAEVRLNLDVKNYFLKIFSLCYSKTGWGQILDSIYSYPKKLKMNFQITENINKFKTAYYTVYYPMLMGYILTGKKKSNLINKIKHFALPLGIGFQIRDDIIGTFGSQFKTGKSDISDIVEGKFTLLINNTLQMLGKKEKEQFTGLFLKKRKTKTEINKIKEKIIQSGAFDKSYNTMQDLFKKALEQLQYLNFSSQYKVILLDLINYLKEV